jgi:hypothetical protein
MGNFIKDNKTLALLAIIILFVVGFLFTFSFSHAQFTPQQTTNILQFRNTFIQPDPNTGNNIIDELALVPGGYTTTPSGIDLPYDPVLNYGQLLTQKTLPWIMVRSWLRIAPTYKPARCPRWDSSK